MSKLAPLLIMLMASQIPVFKFQKTDPSPLSGDTQQCFESIEDCCNFPCDQDCKDRGSRKGRCVQKHSVCSPTAPVACICKEKNEPGSGSGKGGRKGTDSCAETVCFVAKNNPPEISPALAATYHNQALAIMLDEDEDSGMEYLSNISGMKKGYIKKIVEQANITEIDPEYNSFFAQLSNFENDSITQNETIDNIIEEECENLIQQGLDCLPIQFAGEVFKGSLQFWSARNTTPDKDMDIDMEIFERGWLSDAWDWIKKKIIADAMGALEGYGCAGEWGAVIVGAYRSYKA